MIANTNDMLFEKYGVGRSSINDIDEALNLLNIYGDACLLCINESIRSEAYKKFMEHKSNMERVV